MKVVWIVHYGIWNLGTDSKNCFIFRILEWRSTQYKGRSMCSSVHRNVEAPVMGTHDLWIPYAIRMQGSSMSSRFVPALKSRMLPDPDDIIANNKLVAPLS